MISVLLPTLGRFDMAVNSIKSLYENASNKKDIQVVLRFDDDDFESLDRIEEIPRYPNIKPTVGSHLFGYRSLCEFYNEAASVADGDYLMVWNDDVLMLTKNWDQLITKAANKDDVKILQIKTGSQFPTITRKLYEIMDNRIALHAAIDSYLFFVGYFLNINVTTDIEVNHFYHKGDKVGDDNIEHSLYLRHTFHSLPTKILVQYDCTRIQRYLDQREKNNAVH